MSGWKTSISDSEENAKRKQEFYQILIFNSFHQFYLIILNFMTCLFPFKNKTFSIKKKKNLMVCTESPNKNGLSSICKLPEEKSDCHTGGHPTLQHSIQSRGSECLVGSYHNVAFPYCLATSPTELFALGYQEFWDCSSSAYFSYVRILPGI